MFGAESGGVVTTSAHDQLKVSQGLSSIRPKLIRLFEDLSEKRDNLLAHRSKCPKKPKSFSLGLVTSKSPRKVFFASLRKTFRNIKLADLKSEESRTYARAMQRQQWIS